MKYIALLLLGLSLCLAEKVRYDRHRLISIQPSTEEHLKLLSEWEDEPDFKMWNHVSRVYAPVDVSLGPIAFLKYKNMIEASGMTFTITHENIQEIFDEEQRQMVKNRITNPTKVAGTYVSHAAINSWLDMLATANPSYLKTNVIGKTQGNRDLKTLVFRVGNPPKKIWIDCGIHAREWISPSTCTYVIDKLVKNYNSGNSTIAALFDKYEVHFLPVVNPDGYEYSRSNDRLWRKNRSTKGSTLCLGVDLNRNFGFNWMVAGASSSPCSDTYAGTAADSEPETQAIESIINASPGTWAAFVTIHSYGQWFLTPYGHTYSFPPDYAELKDVAVSTSNVIQSVYGSKFTSGSTSELLYLAAGNSADWAYGKGGIKYSYTIELRPGSGTADSSYGFQLPEDRAPLVGEEIWQGLAYFAVRIGING